MLLLAIVVAFAHGSTAQAAVTFRSCDVESGTAFWPYTLTFTKPAGTATGDLMVINLITSGFYDAGGPPSGWTEIHAEGTPAAFTWYRVAQAGDNTFTTGFMPATSSTKGVISTFTGNHTALPLDGNAKSTGSGTAVTIAGNGMAVPRNGSMRVSSTLIANNTTANYTGMTKESCAHTSSPSVSTAYEAVNAGTLAARTATVTNGTWASQTLLVRPAPTAPAITAISPSVGPNAGGTSVVITGSDFSGATQVQFGGVNASSYTVNNDGQITATAPAGTGTVNVRVTTALGTSPDTAADDYTYYPLPTVTAISPDAGPTAGGTSVTITGTNFTGTTQVQFGGVNATGYTVNNSTTITATAPAGAAGNADVRVTTPGGTTANTAADNYTYYAVPTITSISPASGPEAGGTSVTITGTGFGGLSGSAAVRFGATDAASYVVNNATTITATAPAGTGTQDVRVTTPGGTTANTAADNYTYYAIPTITSISPTSGPGAGGTSVTITGTNFAGLSGAAAVRFGATNATGYVVNNATTITATAPAGTSTQDVRVTTPGGTTANTAADDYTYIPAPAVTSLSPTGGPTAGGTIVTITGTDFTGATQVQFGGTNATGYAVNNATTITATAPAGAAGNADVRVTTPGGTSANTAADNYTYYAVPTITSLSPTNGPEAGGTSVTITGTNFAGLSGAAAVQFGGTNATSYVVNNATTITATAPAGTGTQDVRVTTPGGTSANTAADNYTYVPAPTISSISPDSGPNGGGNTITITGTNFTGATQVQFGGVNATGYSVVNATTITATAPAGTGTVSVRVTTAGGTSANTAADDYTYFAAPTVTSISPMSGPAPGGTSVTITGTNLTGATQVQFGGVNATGYVVDNATTITATAPAGTGTVDVRVTTPGGVTPNTAADDYTYIPGPTVSALSPTAGPTAGGTSVTITGSYFTGATQVQFGGVDATGYSVVNGNTITATAPPGAVGTVSVRVTTPSGTSANTAADDFAYMDGPTITSISPDDGPTAGGTSVTITGTNFTGLSGGAAVRFGATNASSYTVNSATSITATAPAGTGTQDVRVTTPGGTSANTAADDYTYFAIPTVTSISPATGPAPGGTSITITGTNLTGATQVQFGGVNATGYSVVNATTITATAPAGTGTVDVRVTTPGGTTANTGADDYVYIPAPTITALSPTSGPAAGANTVTITGTTLTGATQVTFDGVNATGYSVVNATTITATAPAHAAGIVDVRVTTPSGTSPNTAADNYTYIAQPAITSLAPTQGPDSGGTLVTITGTNFTGATQVRFGSDDALGYTVVNATTITATAPTHAPGIVNVSVTTPGGTSANTAADDYEYLAACGLGSLTATATDFSFTPFTLDGLDRTQSTTTNVQVSDMTGPGAGWKLEIGTTQFTAGPGKVLPANAARITSASSTPLGGNCSTPTTTVSSFPIPLPLSPAKAKVYNAAVGTGLGPVDVELGVDLDVPANVETGTYTSTWTIDLTAAP